MTDLADRLEEIITTLAALDIATAMAGIHQSLPGWPSGGQGSTEDIALTKVEAVALTRDAAKTAHKTYPDLCGDVLRTVETLTGLRVTP
ncbi:MAG: hypothetical protein WC054_13165 [Candidatus Nanopelagicales bacterium]